MVVQLKFKVVIRLGGPPMETKWVFKCKYKFKSKGVCRFKTEKQLNDYTINQLNHLCHCYRRFLFLNYRFVNNFALLKGLILIRFSILLLKRYYIICHIC